MGKDDQTAAGDRGSAQNAWFRLQPLPLGSEAGVIAPALLAQLVDAPCLDERGTFLGTPLGWLSTHMPACQHSPHRHLLWQQGSAIREDWRKQAGYVTRQRNWRYRGREMFDLLALEGQPFEVVSRPASQFDTCRITCGGYALTVAGSVYHLLEQCQTARTQHKGDLEELRQYMRISAGESTLQGHLNDEAFLAGQLEEAHELLAQLRLLGVRLVHPRLCGHLPHPEGCGPTNERLDSDWKSRLSGHLKGGQVEEAAALRAALSAMVVDETGSPTSFKGELFWASQPLLGREVLAALRADVLAHLRELRAVLAQQMVERHLRAMRAVARRRAASPGVPGQAAVGGADLLDAGGEPVPTISSAQLFERYSEEKRQQPGVKGRWEQAYATLASLTAPTALPGVATLLVGREPLRAASFWLIPEEPLVDVEACALRGVPIAWVNVHRSSCPKWPHRHVLWQKGRELRQAALPVIWQRERRYTAQKRRCEQLSDLLALVLSREHSHALVELGRERVKTHLAIGPYLLPVSDEVFDHLQELQSTRWLRQVRRALPLRLLPKDSWHIGAAGAAVPVEAELQKAREVVGFVRVEEFDLKRNGSPSTCRWASLNRSSCATWA